MLGPCLMTLGCVQGMVAYKREAPSTQKEAGVAQVSDKGTSTPLPAAQALPVDETVWPNGFAAPNKYSDAAGTRLSLREIAEPIAAESSETAPLPAQFVHGQIDEPCVTTQQTAPSTCPPTRNQVVAPCPYPRGQMELPLQPGQVQMLDSEVVPLPQGTPAEGQAGVATPGKEPLITLHVDNLEVSKVMELVSRQAKILNILVSPGVSGTVTLDLRDKTVDETLRIIANQCRLSVRREKDVIYISTLAESRQIEEDDMPVRVYRLNYVKSTDVEKMIKDLLSKNGKFSASPDSDVGLASDVTQAGEKSKDVKAGGNSMAGGEVIVVQDYEQILKKVDRIVAEIDVQPVQVLIEAVIVSVRLNKEMELGVNFALLDGAGKAVGVVGDGAAINAAAGFTPASVLAAGGLLKGNSLSGTAEAVPGLKFGFVDKSTTGFLRALETVGETKVLACPRLLVLNKQRAELHLGDKLGYATTTQTQTSTVQTIQFQEVGTQLRLRPFVSSDGMIRLEVRPERSSGLIDANGIPQVNSAQVTSNVIVPDGATIVIGGLMESEVDSQWQGIPFLSRLPWVGYLFRHTDDTVTKKELVVILTPRIWRPNCPEGLNYVGYPRTLNLEKRLTQTPAAEQRDGPSLYELTAPPAAPIGPLRDPPASSPPPIRMGQAAAPVQK